MVGEPISKHTEHRYQLFVTKYRTHSRDAALWVLLGVFCFLAWFTQNWLTHTVSKFRELLGDVPQHTVSILCVFLYPILPYLVSHWLLKKSKFPVWSSFLMSSINLRCNGKQFRYSLCTAHNHCAGTVCRVANVLWKTCEMISRSKWPTWAVSLRWGNVALWRPAWKLLYRVVLP